MILQIGIPFQEQMLANIRWIQSFSNPFLDVAFQLITMLGETMFSLIVVAWIFWCVDKDFGYRMGFACLTSVIVNTAVKAVCRIPRPIGYSGIRSLRKETAGGYSFPSGHTQQIGVFWYSLILKYRKKWMAPVGGILIFLVGLSRLYLGVHTLLDVVGGLLIGLAWVLASNAVFDWSKRKGKPVLLAVLIAPMLIGLLFLRIPSYYKAAGSAFGFWLGYLMESRCIHYCVEASCSQQIAKMGIGLAGLLVLRFLLKAILPAGLLCNFISYTGMVLWMTAGAPFLFHSLFRSPEKSR